MWRSVCLSHSHVLLWPLNVIGLMLRTYLEEGLLLCWRMAGGEIRMRPESHESDTSTVTIRTYKQTDVQTDGYDGNSACQTIYVQVKMCTVQSQCGICCCMYAVQKFDQPIINRLGHTGLIRLLLFLSALSRYVSTMRNRSRSESYFIALAKLFLFYSFLPTVETSE